MAWDRSETYSVPFQASYFSAIGALSMGTRARKISSFKLPQRYAYPFWTRLENVPHRGSLGYCTDPQLWVIEQEDEDAVRTHPEDHLGWTDCTQCAGGGVQYDANDA